VDGGIERDLQRSSDPKEIVLMEVGGGPNHAEPNRRHLLLELGAVHVLANGADVDASTLGDPSQGIARLRSLQPGGFF
jgi:hypothetical protein